MTISLLSAMEQGVMNALVSSKHPVHEVDNRDASSIVATMTIGVKESQMELVRD